MMCDQENDCGDNSDESEFCTNLTDRFSGPYDNVFSSTQCEYIVWYHGESLSRCKSVCLEWPTCTAFNYKDDQYTECVLWACPLPVPTPKSTRSPYKGYSLTPGMCSVGMAIASPSPKSTQSHYKGYSLMPGMCLLACSLSAISSKS
ncbi:unnamed protein product, partial [Meganyctiphanes norvegica]